ncbi:MULTISPECIES: TOMM precursor leader peptide-binding protein [unclassified Corynebacterium]|uniref:TOMM precursor leader peptide-binding protein n=1 Tax=unclassified Corynebacterium TaxID=2624378 RepID=UPI001EF3E7F6|nr:MULTISPECIES: TOMM precursor leader peptide-binding protein [unclassified Corynebacterium]MCG7290717.1 TOMM precursor leader peptide-binding protein [Corynebacterium sp. ACRPZ]MCG7295225.1 TOMM precursor leader peptide-binding protein [Corynebacterium sp. ACRPY]
MSSQTMTSNTATLVKRIDPRIDLQTCPERLDAWSIGSVRSFDFPDAETISRAFVERFDDGILAPDNEMYDGAFADFLEEHGIIYSIRRDWVDSPIEDLYLTSNRMISAETIHQRLEEAQVTVVGDGPLVDRIVTACQEQGLNSEKYVSPEGIDRFDDADVVVAVTKSLADPQVVGLNRLLLEKPVTWIPLFRQMGNSVLIGPFIHPGKTACLECLRLRMCSTIGEIPDTYVEPGTALPMASFRIETSLETIACSLLVQMVQHKIALREYSGLSRPGFTRQLVLDNKGFQSLSHRVIRVPRCGECGGSSELGFPQVWHHGGME